MPLYGSVSPGYNPAFRNLLINGDMSVWQKGTSGSSSSGSVISDMFSIEPRSSTTTNWAQSTDVPSGEGFSYSMRLYATNGTDDGFHWKKAIEIPTGNYSRFAAGKKFVLSYWAKSAYSSRTINPTILLSNSTVSHTAYSQSVTSNEGTVTLTTSWQKFTHTYTMPTWAADLGSLSSVTMLYIRFLQGSDNTPQDTYITGIQFEEGVVPTPFEFRPYNIELSLCQRYFQCAPESASSAGGARVYGSSSYLLPVTMRAAPTAAVYGVGGRNASSGYYDKDNIGNTGATPGATRDSLYVVPSDGGNGWIAWKLEAEL